MLAQRSRWLVVVALVGWLVTMGSAQQAEPQLYVVLSYFKVLPGQGEAYQAFVTTTSKKFYQELFATTPNLVHWSTARVMYKGVEGGGQDYDYVSATVTNGPPPEPGRNLDAIYAKLGTNQADYQKKLGALRTVVGSEVLRRVAGTSATGAGTSAEGDFRVGNQMRIKPGMGSEFTDRTVSLSKPMFQEMVAQGDLKAWSMWTRVFPAGAATEYDALGVTTFKDLASAIGGTAPANRGAERFMKANPGKSYSNYVSNGLEYSTSERRTISQVIALVERAASMRTSQDQ